MVIVKVLTLLMLISCQNDYFKVAPTPVATTTQHFFAFTSLSANLSPLGCPITMQKVQWPTFKIQEVAQDLTTCMPNSDLYMSYNSHIQALTKSGDVIFSTGGANIEPGINSFISHIYYWNQASGVTERVSKGLLGAEPNDDSFGAVTSSDGRYICYDSRATNIVAGDTNGVNDIFLYDKNTDSTIRIQNGATEPNSDSGACSISRDGKFLAFSSTASNLVAADLNGVEDVFVYNIQTQSIEIVSVSSAGVQGAEAASYPYISGNGRFVVFTSDQLDGDLNSDPDVYVRDRQNNTTKRISKAFNGGEIDDSSYHPSIDDSGRYVTYSSGATNILSSAAPNNNGNVYLYDSTTNTTILVSKSYLAPFADGSSYNGNITADGKYIVFQSYSTDLISGGDGGGDVYVYDVAIKTNHLISKKEDGTPGDAGSFLEF